jgi:hypothetical protein
LNDFHIAYFLLGAVYLADTRSWVSLVFLTEPVYAMIYQ